MFLSLSEMWLLDKLWVSYSNVENSFRYTYVWVGHKIRNEIARIGKKFHWNVTDPRLQLPFSLPTPTPIHHTLCAHIFLLFHFISSTVGIDYVPATREIQFQTTPDTVCQSFTILEDTEVEPVETFGLLLETSNPAVQLTDTFATVSISDSTGLHKIIH